MKTNKKNLIIFIVCLVFLIAMIGLLITINQVDKKTETNTFESFATVSKVETINTGKNIYVEIFTNEYDNSFHITPSISKHLNMDDINGLQGGDEIVFRIENDDKVQINKVRFIEAVSLKTSKGDIFTLSDYNAYMSIAAKPARIVVTVLVFVLFLVLLYNVIALIKTRSKCKEEEKAL